MSVRSVIIATHRTKGQLMNYENDEFFDEFYATTEPVIIANCIDCRDETELMDGIICWTCSLERSEMKFFDLFERDEFRMQSRMADAEMGDL
jgi:hypothetical protein